MIDVSVRIFGRCLLTESASFCAVLLHPFGVHLNFFGMCSIRILKSHLLVGIGEVLHVAIWSVQHAAVIDVDTRWLRATVDKGRLIGLVVDFHLESIRALLAGAPREV